MSALHYPRTLCILPLLALLGCNSPAWPERDGSAALLRRGFDEAVVQQVVRGEALEPEVYESLERTGDVNVLFLLARNPSLGADRLRRLVSHRNDFVRSGAARNPSLSVDLARQLMADESHTVWTGLAANPGLDASLLLELHSTQEIDWTWFALNPACPPEVEAAIRASGEEGAVTWLERTRKGRKGWPIETKPGS